MKFGERIFNEAVAEWRPAYVQYRKLTDILDHIAQKYPRPTVQDLSPAVTSNVPTTFEDEDDNVSLTINEHVADSPEEKFFMEAVEAELEKVNVFFAKQQQELARTREQLEAQLAALYIAHQTKGRHGVTAVQDTQTRLVLPAVVVEQSESRFARLNRLLGITALRLRRRTRLIEQGFQEYYRNLEMLRSYRELNETAFYKIMKKHDKVTGLKCAPKIKKEVSKCASGADTHIYAHIYTHTHTF